jgi:GNAT superfamily N-acetyltransferase
MDIELECVSEPTPEVRQLLGELDEALSGPYSADQRHALSVDQLFQPNIRFFLARLDGVAVACGGVAFLDGYGEVKRMYSRPSVRGRGVAKRLLRRIEAETRDAGLSLLRIETGIYQEEALRFYEGAGFRRCGPFGPYAALPSHAIETSLFYEKTVQSH